MMFNIVYSLTYNAVFKTTRNPDISNSGNCTKTPFKLQRMCRNICFRNKLAYFQKQWQVNKVLAGSCKLCTFIAMFRFRQS